LGGLWSLEWAWHPAEVNLRCARVFRKFMPNPKILAFIVSENTSFIRTDGHRARSTRLVIGSETLLPVTYFPTNLVYPFTP